MKRTVIVVAALPLLLSLAALADGSRPPPSYLTGGTGTCPTSIGGSPTGAAVAVSVEGFATALVSISGTWVATASFSVADATGAFVQGIGYGASDNTSGVGTASLTTTANGKWRVLTAGQRMVCVSLTAWTSGTLRVDVELTPAPVMMVPLGHTDTNLLPFNFGNFNSAGTGSLSSALLVGELPAVSLSSAPAVNTQATVSTGACGASCRRVGWTCTGSIRTVAAQAGALQLVLRDGATGAGTILWQEEVGGCAINTQCKVQSPILNAVGSLNTSMTCEWTGVPSVGNFEIVNLQYRNAN